MHTCQTYESDEWHRVELVRVINPIHKKVMRKGAHCQSTSISTTEKDRCNLHQCINNPSSPGPSLKYLSSFLLSFQPFSHSMAGKGNSPGSDKRKITSSYYPLDRSCYKILHEIGSGVSAVVYKAECLPLNSATVAIKAIDLERTRANLDEVRREAKAMTLLSHPNILTAHCSFTVDSHLWVVMPFMEAGSLYSIISSAFPNGLPEPCIAVILKETLLALRYLHTQGHLHRDIKAGNILLDSDGSVRLADFGVSASIYERSSSSSSSNSLSSFSLSFCNDLAGTPYWMAPEVIHSHVGYGFKADIWSFGITALELAHGRPPLSHLPPSKSLVMRITSRLGLNYEDEMNKKTKKDKKTKKKISKAFKDMVGSCLSQDPSSRPSADKLLKHPFFKSCKSPDYLVRHVLRGLPAVEERFRDFSRCPPWLAIPDKEEDRDSDDPSLPTKNRRISGWNFNEDVFELDPVFPTGHPDAISSTKKVSSMDEEEGSSTHQNGSASPSSSSSSISTSSSSSFSMEGSNRAHEKKTSRGPVDEKAAERTKTEKDEEACKVEGGEASLVPKGSTNAAAAASAMIPGLLSLLGSLRLEQQMVMNVLEACRGGGNVAGGSSNQREHALVETAEKLQQTVDALNLQIEHEKCKNAALERQIQALKQTAASDVGVARLAAIKLD
ncbi:hypothetical protein ACLOJK_010141 [Asimina triloba]